MCPKGICRALPIFSSGASSLIHKLFSTSEFRLLDLPRAAPLEPTESCQTS